MANNEYKGRLLRLSCLRCGARFTSLNWRLRCPRCVGILSEAMRAALRGETNDAADQTTRPPDADVLEMLRAMRPDANQDSMRLFMDGRLSRTPYLHVDPDEFRRIAEWAKAKRQ